MRSSCCKYTYVMYTYFLIFLFLFARYVHLICIKLSQAMTSEALGSFAAAFLLLSVQSGRSDCNR